MVQFCSLIDKTVDLLHDTLTKINGKIVQRTSSKANAFNLMPALTEYITTENSLDRVALHYVVNIPYFNYVNTLE